MPRKSGQGGQPGGATAGVKLSAQKPKLEGCFPLATLGGIVYIPVGGRLAREGLPAAAVALKQLTEDPNIELRPFPPEVLQLFQSIMQDVVTELMAADPASAKIGKAYFDYMELAAPNSRITEKAYLDTREY